ncbi:RNase adapter RapZ [Oceanicola sp. 502str15]|uniref:RNase adapter RapZ n=1 Tax=Oceanicola sp. 502str15 TaxID=2696061 RepID=UPI00209597E2|nr:RNase adapter RapZ [Oceanicola sp. 502str15]MCO6384997.1 RNase adapter RapZ [Oceanicola sp. 502str15]
MTDTTDTDTHTGTLPHSSAVQRLVLVTGPAGAGRSSAVRVLEDLGYEAIDNLPLSLVPRLLEGQPRGGALALGIDSRNRDFATPHLIDLLSQLDARPDIAREVLYLDCSPEVLLRRYSETRRRHPLAPAESPEAGIARDFDLLADIRERADVLIDTSDLSVHDLREELDRLFTLEATVRLGVSVQSFSYKRGLPHGLDMVFDCRFLNNPHWQPALRPLDGRDPAVVAHVEADPRFAEFHNRVRGLVDMLLPAFVEEGKSHLSIGFGCTGGQHRSVALAERFGKELAGAGWRVSIRHREIERRAGARAAESPAAALGTLA